MVLPSTRSCPAPICAGVLGIARTTFSCFSAVLIVCDGDAGHDRHNGLSCAEVTGQGIARSRKLLWLYGEYDDVGACSGACWVVADATPWVSARYLRRSATISQTEMSRGRRGCSRGRRR